MPLEKKKLINTPQKALLDSQGKQKARHPSLSSYSTDLAGEDIELINVTFRFVQKFAANTELGIASRIHLLELSDDDRKKTILKNEETVAHLERVSQQKMMEATEYKTKVITKLAEQLSNYLKSDAGR
ncbi:Hypothetical predicted protein [Mytilus galloprovincialis]|uniref:Uncharacterized protein n=1 Tax=Mytilus galloprovincialis TaxID=29158 RepID=A0A8B6F533_MYTGA|nr:Hypothetical predicted protein [Mytilus galloprovincialis]